VHATIENILQEVFYVIRTMSIARQRVTKHIPAEANEQNNRISIARQRRSKQAVSSMVYLPRNYERTQNGAQRNTTENENGAYPSYL
jgi:hypothetical protein